MEQILKLTKDRENLKASIAEEMELLKAAERDILYGLLRADKLDYISVNWTKLNRVARGHGY